MESPIHILNFDELKNRLDDDFQLFIELSSMFLDNSETLLSKLLQAIQHGEPGAIEKSAHTIKGAVANFSAERAYDCAKNLEEIALINDRDAIAIGYRQLKVEMGLLADRLREVQKIGSFSVD